MGGALSSFAISIAANIVTSLFARNDTEKEIRKAFQEAIEMWCPNEDIRRFKEKDIYKFVNGYIVNPAIDSRELSEELKSFLDCFEKCIANHHSAALYLSAIKEKDYYDIAMASLNLVHAKLDSISKKLDVANPRHEELHFEAVAEINTVLEEETVDAVNVFLYGILAAFDHDIYAYIEEGEDKDLEVVIDKDSLLQEEDGGSFRPKFHDFDYDWDQEVGRDWSGINPDLDFWKMFSESYMAAFQLMRIDFYDSIEELHRIIDRKTINDQLSKDEKRLLTEIIASMRAIQSIIEDHSDMLEHPTIRDKKTNKYSTRFFYRTSIPMEFVERRQTRTGYINVSCPELTAIDLVTYQARSGSVTRAATVLAELVEKTDFRKYGTTFLKVAPTACFQRLGSTSAYIQGIRIEYGGEVAG